MAGEAKHKQWKSVCDTVNRGTTLTYFWQFHRQMEGTPALIDGSRVVLKTSNETGSALLRHFVKQSNQNNLDERKGELNRTPAAAGSNDDLITKLEFTESLSGLNKDTAPDPDNVKCSDIKNLSVDNESELFRLYEERFTTGPVPRIGHIVTSSHSPNRKKTVQAERITYPQNTTGKLTERIVARKIAQDLQWVGGGGGDTPPKPRRIYNRNNQLGKCSQICIRCLQRI